MTQPIDEPAAVDASGMRHQLRLFFLALQFFTRLPVPGWVGFREIWMAQAVRYFPLTGWLVGAAAALAGWGASCILPPVPGLILATIVSVLMTGALHEDGFADACDGFGGGMSRERILDIMKDSRIGVFGALGLGLLLALKLSCLGSLPMPFAVAALMAAHPLSRAFALTLMWRLDYARSEGKAAPLAHRMGGGDLVFTLICGVLPLLLLLCFGSLPWMAALCGLLLALGGTLYLARLFARRIGGYTGDCLGAVQQVTEAGFYLGLASWYFYAARAV